MSSAHRFGLVLVCAWAAFTGHPVAAGDWGQWRGPTRDGHAEVFGKIDRWPTAPVVVWSVAAGDGQSSPLAVGDRVVVFDRVDGHERVRALDLRTGAVLWQAREPVRFRPGMGAGRFGAGPKSTPAVSEDRVVTYGVTSLLTVRKLSSGELIWRKDRRKEGPKPTLYWGNSMSPIVVDGQVIVQFGKAGKGGIRAYHLEDGRELWRVEEFGTSYSSPIVVETADERTLALMTGEGPIGLSMRGELLWQIDFEQSFTRQNTPTPVYAKGVLVFGGESRPLGAHRIGQRAGAWRVESAWTRDDISLSLASTVVVGGRVCGISAKRKGQLFCLELATGADVWLGPPRAGDHAVLLVVPDYLLVMESGGRLLVLDRVASSYEPVVEYEVAESAVYAHPAVVPRGLVIKSKDRIERLSFGD